VIGHRRVPAAENLHKTPVLDVQLQGPESVWVLNRKRNSFSKVGARVLGPFNRTMHIRIMHDSIV